MVWKKSPMVATHWDTKNIKYAVFVDESGHSDTKFIKKLIKNEKLEELNNLDYNERFLTIGCVIFDYYSYEKAKNRISIFKNKYWHEGMWDYYSKQLNKTIRKKVVLHSTDIKNEKGPFDRKVINFNDFATDLSEFLSETNYKIITVTIDKVKYLTQEHYYKETDPYHTAVEMMFERIGFLLKKESATANIIFETRGEKENKALLRYSSQILEKGSYYKNRYQFKFIKGIYFNEKWSKEDNFEKSYFGLEIVDLILMGVKKYAIEGKKGKDFLCIEDKLYNYPRYKGYGVKKYP